MFSKKRMHQVASLYAVFNVRDRCKHIVINLRHRALMALAFLLLYPTLGPAQTSTQTISKDKLLFNIKLWTPKDGLPQRNYEGGFQDSRGIVWLAYQQALYRFDGQQFTAVWEEKDKLYDFHLSTLSEDGQHNIWWYRRNRYNPKAPRQIFIYAPDEGKRYTLDEYVGEAAAKVLLNADRLFFNHIDQSLHISDPKSGRRWRYNDRLELLNELNGTSNVYTKPSLINLSPRHINHEMQDAPISVRGGYSVPFQVDYQEKPVVEDLNAFLNRQLNSVLVDYPDLTPEYFVRLNDGQLLLPTVDKQFLQIEIKPNYFQTIMEGFNMRGLATREDRLYAVLSEQQSHLYEIDLKYLSYRLMRTAELTGDHFNLSLENGQTYISTGYGKLLQTTPDFQQLIRTFLMPGDSSIHGNEVRCILHRPDSLIWHGSYRGITEVNLKTGRSRYLLKDYNVYWLHEDHEGAVWAGTNKGVYHVQNQTFYLSNLPDGQTVRVAHIHQQNLQTFWLATHQGLIRWTPYTEEYQLYTEEDGLSNNILHAIYGDHKGRLWISSNNGITSFDLETAAITLYFETDGLCSNEQNLISHTQGEDGHLYFGSLSGINGFFPDSIPTVIESLEKGFTIEQLLLYDANGTVIQSLAFPTEAPFSLDLPRACKQIAIDLIKPYFGFSRLNLEWRIPSKSQLWQRVNEDEQIFLLNLPYGEFEIQLRAWSAKTKSHPTVTTLHFFNPFPVYMQPFFWVGVILAVLGLFFVIYRWRSNTIRANNRRLNEEVRKRTQDLKAQKQTILEQNQQLARVDEAKNRLFNNISHELRSPLTLIQVSAEQLTGKDTAALGQLSVQIRQQAQKMTGMIEDIMDLTKMELGVLKEERKVVDWNSLVKQQFSMFESLADKKQLEYQLSLSPNGELPIRVDRKKAETVLSNLINNAVKYTPEQGHILVQSQLKGTELAVSVQDTGPGLEAGEQQAVFKRYYQGKASKGLAQPGYGIGLALCNEYIKLMGGGIWVESELGKGATFKFTLPVATAVESENHTAKHHVEALPVEQVVTTPEPATVAEPEKPCILIAEDSEELQQLLLNVLSDEYTIQLAQHGQHAFELLQAQPGRYDLVLSDIMMPVLDGYGLLQKTRSHPQLGFLPFLMLTALSSNHDKMKALRLGVDAFLTKPFETAELKTRIRGLLDNQKKRLAHSSPKATGKTDSSIDSYDEVWLQKLETIVRENMGRPEYKVTDIADALFISERTLRNYTKSHTGLTPSAYLQKARLDQAHLYLKSKKYRTVAEAAYAVGFKNRKHFSKLFKKAYGKPPSDYVE